MELVLRRLAHKFHAVIDQYIDKAIVRKAKPDLGESSADTPHRYIMLDGQCATGQEGDM